MRVVLKLGGSILETGEGPAPAPALIAAIARARAAGHELALVHGGGKTLTALLARLGVETRFEQGLRVTCPASLRAAVMAFAGEVNTALVAALERAGVRAAGLTGLDGSSVRGAIERPELGAVGAVTACEPALWQALLACGITPVIASLIAEERGGAGGGILNVNADLMAAAVAGALGAERLLFVTDVPGVLSADGVRLPQVSLAGLASMAAQGALHGGMLPKADACRAALEAGVPSVEIVGSEAVRELDAVLESGACPGTIVYSTEATQPQ